MRRRVVAALGTLAAGASMAGCGLQAGLSQQPGTGPSPTQAPPIAATSTVSGRAFDWSSLRGRPIVLDFWASWCGPCRAEQKDVNALAGRYATRGVAFLGIDMRDDDAAARAYESDFSVAYPSVADPDEQISAAYDVAAPPTIVLVDRSGRIVGRFLGTVVGLGGDLDHVL